MSAWRSERGAAAVEFALVMPVLLALMLGVIEIGRAYNVQISLTHAARETARDMAIHQDWSGAMGVGRQAAPALSSQSMTFIPDVDKCGGDAMYEVTIQYQLATLTGIAESLGLAGAKADSLTITGKAAMRCGG